MPAEIEEIARAICVADGGLPDFIALPIFPEQGDVPEPVWRKYIPHARAAILAYESAKAGDAGAVAGFKLVPIEPLPEMLGAFWRVKNGHHYHDEPAPTDRSDYAAYRAMLSASPTPPAPAAPAGMVEGWQPISTAPKDGTKVDLWIVDQDGEGWRMPDAAWHGEWIDNQIYESGPCERSDKNTVTGEPYFERATHWMPVPTAPATDAKDGV